jgi:hypothetical protein
LTRLFDDRAGTIAVLKPVVQQIVENNLLPNSQSAEASPEVGGGYSLLHKRPSRGYDQRRMGTV